LTRQPVLAGTFALGLAALLGLPPFSLFVSELALARAATAAGLGWAVAAALVLLLVVFVAVAARTAGMLFGSAGPETERHGPPTRSRAGAAVAAAPLVTGLVVLAVLGTLAWPLEQLLRAAAAIAGTS
jgi:hydrogenase-4 component F